MIVNQWPEKFRQLYGSDFPETYCAIDCETTGFDPKYDVIIEYGHCLVVDRVVVNQFNMVLDWTGHPTVKDTWLRERLRKLDRAMKLDGRPWRLDYEVLRAEGAEPKRSLEFILEFIGTLCQQGTMFAAHNGVFDERMLKACFADFLEIDWPGFGENNLMDTGGIEKASQAMDNAAMHPRPGDTLHSYFQRVSNARVPNVKWNLDTHCFKKYRLGDKPGVPEDGRCHTAGFDAFLVHLMMEEIRKQLSAGPEASYRGTLAGDTDDFFGPRKLQEQYDRMMAGDRSLVSPTEAKQIAAKRAMRPGQRRRGQRNC